MSIEELIKRLEESKHLAEIAAINQEKLSYGRGYLEGKAAGLADAICWIKRIEKEPAK